MTPQFSPTNPIVKYCIQAIILADSGKPEEAAELLSQAWHEAADDFERFMVSYHLAQQQTDIKDRLKWLESSLACAQTVDDISTRSALPLLYASIADCHEALNNHEQAKVNADLSNAFKTPPADEGPFFHGTKADLKIGDYLTAGGVSNYQSDLKMNHIYFTALISGAGLAAALAKGEGRERVYMVEPTGPYEDDPNVTDKKFPGNLTRSYRSQDPLRIIGEVEDWQKQTPESLRQWREKLANNPGEIIN